jgi:hypothetical protein
MGRHLWPKEQWLFFAYYQRRENTTGRDLFVYHCLIHQENLCAKSVKMTNVITVVAKLVYYIRSKGLNHSQFQQFLSDMDSENGDVLYYTVQKYAG